MNQFEIKMPKRLSWSEAMSDRRENKNNNWCELDSEGQPKQSFNTATGRFNDSFFNVYNNPRFCFDKEAKVYTIGSCFARNVEQELLNKKFNLPALSVDFDWSIYKRKPAYKHTILNKYNTHSVADEILRAVGKNRYEYDGLLEVKPECWFDPQSSHTDPGTFEVVADTRRKLNLIQDELLTSDVLILTLGLTETWQHVETGVVFNQLHPVALRPIADKMQFFNSTLVESYTVLAEALEALKDKVPNIKVIVTVSPVPLTQTFTKMDVVTANTYSKSTLRCVAQMLFDDFSYVDYFPSYEMVINSPRGSSWHADQIHPSRPLVSNVISEFSSRYITT